MGFPPREALGTTTFGWGAFSGSAPGNFVWRPIGGSPRSSPNADDNIARKRNAPKSAPRAGLRMKIGATSTCFVEDPDLRAQRPLAALKIGLLDQIHVRGTSLRPNPSLGGRCGSFWATSMPAVRGEPPIGLRSAPERAHPQIVPNIRPDFNQICFDLGRLGRRHGTNLGMLHEQLRCTIWSHSLVDLGPREDCLDVVHLADCVPVSANSQLAIGDLELAEIVIIARNLLGLGKLGQGSLTPV